MQLLRIERASHSILCWARPTNLSVPKRDSASSPKRSVLAPFLWLITTVSARGCLRRVMRVQCGAPIPGRPSPDHHGSLLRGSQMASDRRWRAAQQIPGAQYTITASWNHAPHFPRWRRIHLAQGMPLPPICMLPARELLWYFAALAEQYMLACLHLRVSSTLASIAYSSTWRECAGDDINK